MAERSFPVFYCDFLRDLSISSSKPEPLAADRLVPLAEQLLVAEDNYLGVVDPNDVILQLYLSGREMVVELIFPESTGILQSRMPVEEALALLADLPDEFTEELLPGASYLG
ncbi:MAG TPA: hypothetical protein ENJ98_06270 [Thiolapillus brandeum]|uniref:Uncharacterized protein n=1 Tax=Thiolapillus brandeum TaxID=1076588 RepID=A0A7C5N8U2_9GAMM|nr:hypothetical protein [Thiolapillus brandeum]